LARRRKRRRSALRGFYRLLVALSAVIVGVWCAYKLSARRPATAGGPRPPAAESAGTPPAAGSGNEGLIRREDTWTFLLAAEDQISGSTDTIMVCTYDTKAQRVGLVSVPRDTLVDRPGWRYHKLNAVYPNGNYANPPDGGIWELMDAVSELLGIPIDHYVFVDTRIFVELVDEMGGVDFDVPVHMSYDDPLQDLHIHFEPGMQHLSGQEALEVVRCRKNSDGSGSYPHNIYDAYPDADIGRTRTQQEMVKAILKKALANPQKLGAYAQLAAGYVRTDLSLSNLLWFVEPALGFDLSGLTTATLPGDGSVSYDGVDACYALDIPGSLAIINDCLNPYTTDVTEDMVRMVQG